MQSLTYQDNQNGQTINIKTAKGKPYSVSVQRARELPWVEQRVRGSRWNSLKIAIATQSLGEWYVYSGFGSEGELKLASGVVGRYKQDKILKAKLNGHKVEQSLNKELLQLAVRIVEG